MRYITLPESPSIAAWRSSECEWFLVGGLHVEVRSCRALQRICVQQRLLNLLIGDSMENDDNWRPRTKLNLPGIVNMSRARQYKLGNCPRRATHHWSGSHPSHSSRPSLKYSSSSLRSRRSFFLYRAVKFTLEGDVSMGADEPTRVSSHCFAARRAAQSIP